MGEQLEGQTSLKEENNLEELLNNAAENAEMQSEEEKEEHLKNVGKRTHESHIGEWTVGSILKAWSQKKIILPLCQRLFVWNKKQQMLLLDSIERGLKCGSFELATWEGHGDTQYLCDGLQRLTSLMLMSNDKTLTEEQRKLIRDYKISMEVVYNLDDEEMSMWFLRLNSGVVVSTATKERNKLPSNLNNAILKISNNQFFNDISKRANATFSKNSHNDIISSSALLACSGVEITDMKAKALCNNIKNYESDIINSIDKTDKLINRLSDIYNKIEDNKIAKRSLNANFLAVLVHVMAKNDFTNEQIVQLIKYIFAQRSAVQEYRLTTGSRTADKEKCLMRYNVLIKLLNNLTDNNGTNKTDFNKEAYKEFCKQHKTDVLNTRSSDYPVSFTDITEDERKLLYTFCEVDKNANKYEGVIMKAYNRVAKETSKESA